MEASDYSARANVASKRQITTKCTSCTEGPLPRPSGYEPVLSRRRFAYFFHCEETRHLVSIFTYIDPMLLNLGAPVSQQMKRKFVNLSVFKNF